MSPKEKRQQLASDIRRSQSDAATALKALLPLMLDEVKDSLVDAEGLELTRLQGEARAIKKLLTMITREPVAIKKGE